MRSPSHCPGRPCQIRQQLRSRLSRGAGPFLRQEPPEEPFPRRAAAGPLRHRPVPPAAGRKRAPAPRAAAGGRAPTPSRRGTRPRLSSRRRRKPGESGPARRGHERHRGRAPAPAPAAGESGARGLCEIGGSWGASGLSGFGVSGVVARMVAVTPGLFQQFRAVCGAAARAAAPRGPRGR